jgi:hypothetical protein
MWGCWCGRCLVVGGADRALWTELLCRLLMSQQRTPEERSWTPTQWTSWRAGFFTRHRQGLGRCSTQGCCGTEIFSVRNCPAYCRQCWLQHFRSLGDVPPTQTPAQSSASSARTKATGAPKLSPIASRHCQDNACTHTVNEDWECEFCPEHCLDATCPDHGAVAQARASGLALPGDEAGTESTRRESDATTGNDGARARASGLALPGDEAGTGPTGGESDATTGSAAAGRQL